MSTTGIEAVLSRAMSDAIFADALFSNAEKALTGFDLTTEEVAKFKNMSRAEFAALATEERKSFSMFTGGDDKVGGNNHNQTALYTRK